MEKERSSGTETATSGAWIRRQKARAACAGVLPERSWATDQADFREEIASGEELPGKKSELKQLGEKQAVVFTVVLWNV